VTNINRTKSGGGGELHNLITTFSEGLVKHNVRYGLTPSNQDLKYELFILKNPQG